LKVASPGYLAPRCPAPRVAHSSRWIYSAVCEGTVKSRAARGRMRLLPQLAYLHLAAPEQARGNRPSARRVLPARERG
jgi:hypothetical protein